jgi:hypothetical protein
MSTLVRNVLERFRTRGWRRAALYAVYRFDDAFQLWRLGIRSAMNETSVSAGKEELGLNNPDCSPLNPTESFHSFHAVMKRFVNPCDTDVFLDYGSGLGRVLLMAATFPFRRIVGVEYSQELNDTAAKIIRRVRGRLKCRDIELVTADAAQYELPPDVNVIYFYNPFCGATLARVCDRIRQSLLAVPRRLKIVYYAPGHFDALVVRHGWVARRGEMAFPAVSEYPFACYESVPVTEAGAGPCEPAENTRSLGLTSEDVPARA